MTRLKPRNINKMLIHPLARVQQFVSPSEKQIKHIWQRAGFERRARAFRCRLS
jgi:hypothetical protein